MHPKLKLNENEIEKLAEFGLKYTELAELYGCHVDTIKSKYKEVYDRGRANLKQSLKAKQIQEAMAGNTTLLIWLGKQYLGQADKLSEDSTTAKITVNIGGNRDKPEIKEED